MDQSGGAAVQRRGVNNGAVRPRVGEEGGHDGSHAGIENRGVGPTRVQRHDLVFQNLRVGVREARINQVGTTAVLGFDLARGDGEGVLGLLRTGEHVGGTAENGGPRRTHGKRRIETQREYCRARTHYPVWTGPLRTVLLGHSSLQRRVYRQADFRAQPFCGAQ